ncbi:MAG: 4'-phosphopantetheinyl transferase superfamily protein [Acidimicrobiales bacterium]|jgi:holo-[acyl-carrier protein] synthase
MDNSVIDAERAGRIPKQQADHPRMAVGIDAVVITEVQSALSLFGNRYLTRVFTPHEIACASDGKELRAFDLAVCFAAKEATLKALGPNVYIPPWQSIEVHHETNATCCVRLSGLAAELASRARLSRFVVSFDHLENLAIAVVFAAEGTCP